MLWDPYKGATDLMEGVFISEFPKIRGAKIDHECRALNYKDTHKKDPQISRNSHIGWAARGSDDPLVDRIRRLGSVRGIEDPGQ